MQVPQMMKAWILNRYGAPEEVLTLDEVEVPKPKATEVLVKTYASPINDYDWSMVSGRPRIYQLLFGIGRPKRKIPGMELSGKVVEAGAEVNRFKKGDAVFGDLSEYAFGSMAEFVCVDEKGLLPMPEFLKFTQAAAIPHAGALASQGMFDYGNVVAGQKILINGGGGGVGTIALTLAKQLNCHVTGVDAQHKLQWMRSLGYDEVIAYENEDFTKRGVAYDFILDCKTKRSVFSIQRALRQGGKYVSIGGTPSHLLSLALWGKLLSVFSSKSYRILPLKANKGLDRLLALLESEVAEVQVDGPYSSADVPRLIQLFGEGKHKGKIIVEWASEDASDPQLIKHENKTKNSP